jgi:hypothetical protein
VRCRSFTVTAIGFWIMPVTGKPKPVVIGPSVKDLRPGPDHTAVHAPWLG